MFICAAHSFSVVIAGKVAARPEGVGSAKESAKPNETPANANKSNLARKHLGTA
jgi:hypothetical protein